MELMCNDCIDFLMYWNMKQSFVFSSSAFCEPIGNNARICIQKVVGREKKHERCECIIIIKSHSSGSQQVTKTLVRGVPDHLVDIDSGSVMSDDKANENRRKYVKDGKVIERLRYGKETRYTVPFLLTAAKVRLAFKRYN